MSAVTFSLIIQISVLGIYGCTSIICDKRYAVRFTQRRWVKTDNVVCRIYRSSDAYRDLAGLEM